MQLGHARAEADMYPVAVGFERVAQNPYYSQIGDPMYDITHKRTDNSAHKNVARIMHPEIHTAVAIECGPCKERHYGQTAMAEHIRKVSGHGECVGRMARRESVASPR